MRWAVCAIALMCLSGCGVKEQIVRVNVPDVHANPQHGLLVQVNPVRDNREASFLAQFPAASRAKNVGGFVRGGNGVNLVLESSTTALKVHSIIAQALRNMGYRTVSNCEASCPVVTPTLDKFAVTLPFDFWRALGSAQHMLADIAVRVDLQDRGRTSTFDAIGHGSNIYQVVSQENWEIALDRATKHFVTNFQQQMISHMDQAAVGTAETAE